MAEAFIVGLGETPHAPRRDDVNTTEIAYEAVKAALADAGVALAEVGSAITASQDFWEGRTISSMAVNEIAGATFKSESKTASDGTLALTYAAMRIVSGIDSLMLVQEYGVWDKVLFGTDYPFTTVDASIDGIRKLNDMLAGTALPRLNTEAIEKMFYRDTLKILEIEG